MKNYQQIILLLFLFVIFISSSSKEIIKTEKNERKLKSFMEMVELRNGYIEEHEFDYDLFVEYLRINGINNIEIVVSQAILETGTFRSDIFNKNNNLFGMKHPRVRPTTSLGSDMGHAVYEHWTCSVKDYKLWYYYMTKKRKYDNYMAFLTSVGYAEDYNYLFKLRTIKERLITENMI